MTKCGKTFLRRYKIITSLLPVQILFAQFQLTNISSLNKRLEKGLKKTLRDNVRRARWQQRDRCPESGATESLGGIGGGGAVTAPAYVHKGGSESGHHLWREGV